MRLEVRPGAQADVGDAAAWYESQREGLGLAFIEALERAFEGLSASATRHPIWMVGRPYRRLLLAKFPYAVLYRMEADRVVVVAVAHVRRQPGYWLARDAE